MIWRRVEAGNNPLKMIAWHNIRDIYMCAKWYKSSHAVLMSGGGEVLEVIPALASEIVIVFDDLILCHSFEIF